LAPLLIIKPKHGFGRDGLKQKKRIGERTSAGSPSYYIAAVYTAMNENNLAIQYLEKAYQ
jgi:hypothetical protein